MCLRIWSRETGSAVPSRVSLLILHILRANLMLAHGIPPDFRGGVHLFIKKRHTPSGQSRVHRVTQLRTDGVHSRESAGTGPDPVVLKVVPVTGAAFLHVIMDQLICASLSHTHYWYEVGMLIAILHKYTPTHPCYTILYYTILYYTILYYTIL